MKACRVLHLAAARAQTSGLRAARPGCAVDRAASPNGEPQRGGGKAGHRPTSRKENPPPAEAALGLLVFSDLPPTVHLARPAPLLGVEGHLPHSSALGEKRRHPWGAGWSGYSHLPALTLLGSAKRNFRREGVLKL